MCRLALSLPLLLAEIHRGSGPGIVKLLAVLAMVCLGILIVRFAVQRISWQSAVALGLLVPGLLIGLFAGLYGQTSGQRIVEVEPLPAVLPTAAPEIVLTPPDEAAKAKRPEWVESPPTLTADVYRFSLASDPKLTANEALADLQAKEQVAVQHYLTELLGPEAEQSVTISPELIATEMRRETFLEPVQLSVGPMIIAHAQMRIDSRVRDEFRAQFQAAEVQWRMVQAGSIAGLVLGVVALLLAALKLDTATRGFYTGRLQLASAVLILGIVWAGYALVLTPK